MNISGKELKELIPDEEIFCLDSIQMTPRDNTYLIVNLGHKHGGLSILVYRKSLGKLLLKTQEPPSKVEKVPKAVTPPTTAHPKTDDAGEEGRVYAVGMTRKKDGVLQRLEGFTSSSSLREKPVTAQRRVQHPTTKQMVWPIWVETKV